MSNDFRTPLRRLDPVPFSPMTPHEDAYMLHTPSDSDTQTDPPPPPLPVRQSLWDCLQEELHASQEPIDVTMGQLKRERVSNFVHIPIEIERLMLYGLFICLDAFLYTFTIFPLRVRAALSTLWKDSKTLTTSQKADLYKALLLILCVYALQYMDAATMYHSIRGQSVFKLYVIFNVLEIGDKLCCSFGHDILDSFLSKIRRQSSNDKDEADQLGFLTHFLIAAAYILAHTLVLFYQCITLNVAILSYGNALVTLLVSNQFGEIKSHVFKRFEKENLFQLTCADILERFQLSVYLFIIAIRNIIELSSQHSESLSDSWLPELPSYRHVMDMVVAPVLIVFGCEMLVDWLKHAFITKFNHIRPTVYTRFAEVFARDLVMGGIKREDGRKVFVDQSPNVARRIGFSALPLACLVVRITIQTVQTLSVWDANANVETLLMWWTHAQQEFTVNEWVWSMLQVATVALLMALVFFSLVAIKLLIGIHLFRYSKGLYHTMQQRQQQWQHDKDKMENERLKATDSKKADATQEHAVKKHLQDSQDLMMNGHRQPLTLDNLDRFTLFKSRIY